MQKTASQILTDPTFYGPGISCPVDAREDAIRNGQAYTATTGAVVAGADGTYGMALWHPDTNTKNILIYTVEISNEGGYAVADVRKSASDPALGTPLTPVNLKSDGDASSLSTVSRSTAAGSAAGTILRSPIVPQATARDILSGKPGFYIPAGVADGLAIYMFIANTKTYSITFQWIEFATTA